MPIENLRDIRTNVDTIVNSIPVTVSQLTFPGNQLNPNEDFSFTVDASNPVGSVRIVNVRLRVAVGNQAMVRLRVPNFQAPGLFLAVTNLNGTPFLDAQIGLLVNGFIINFPSGHAWDAINPGENVPALSFSGRAISTGNTEILARIIADIDHAWLFPPGQESNNGTRSLSVVS
ncbi:MAG: hypothetical protein IPL46_01935 [Saprospiraceae bacterium]|nr:hypothetical protein [Saprospiraceae bacterium]